jgi:hypothetical protein
MNKVSISDIIKKPEWQEEFFKETIRMRGVFEQLIVKHLKEMPESESHKYVKSLFDNYAEPGDTDIILRVLDAHCPKEADWWRKMLLIK